MSQSWSFALRKLKRLSLDPKYSILYMDSNGKCLAMSLYTKEWQKKHKLKFGIQETGVLASFISLCWGWNSVSRHDLAKTSGENTRRLEDILGEVAAAKEEAAKTAKELKEIRSQLAEVMAKVEGQQRSHHWWSRWQ